MRKRLRNTSQPSGKRVVNTYSRFVALFAYSQLSQNWREWSFRTISHRAATEGVKAGQLAAIYRKKDGTVQLVGYQALQPSMVTRPSATTLTRSTIEAVSNAIVCSHGQRPHLSRRELDELDKVAVWPLIGDTKAVAVRPRISDDDRRRAEKLLAGEPSRCAKIIALRTNPKPTNMQLQVAA